MVVMRVFKFHVILFSNTVLTEGQADGRISETMAKQRGEKTVQITPARRGRLPFPIDTDDPLILGFCIRDCHDSLCGLCYSF